MSAIRMIVGLGNIGAEYEDTRHNAGFWFVDALSGQRRGSFARQAKFHGDVAKVDIDGQPVWLLKPGTYMNLSGKAVQALAAFYRIAAEEILVVHDELDLMPGQSKLKQGGGHAGHNGLKDIQAHLGPSFWRLRLGIGHPRTLELKQETIDFVLHRPRRDERTLIDGEIARGLAIVPDLVQGRIAIAQKNLHTREREARP